MTSSNDQQGMFIDLTKVDTQWGVCYHKSIANSDYDPQAL